MPNLSVMYNATFPANQAEGGCVNLDKLGKTECSGQTCRDTPTIRKLEPKIKKKRTTQSTALSCNKNQAKNNLMFQKTFVTNWE